MKRIFVALIFLFLIMPVWSQDTTGTTRKGPVTIGLRAGIGLQRSFFGEAGIAVQRYHYSTEFIYMSGCIYSTAEWTYTPPGRPPVYGFKVGAEMAQFGSVLAMEAKYQTDFDKADVVFTPRIGFGLSMLYLAYGYNFSTNKRPFTNVGRHQFGIVFNSNFLHSKAKKN